MNVLLVASEAAPFIKTGGLGDVLGALPKALTKIGVSASVILPLYSKIDRKQADLEFLGNFDVSISWRKSYCGIFRTVKNGVTYYFIDNEQYFGRKAIYGEYDDSERFAFFSKAVLDALNFINYFPDIIHINDWQTALLPVYLDAYYRADPRYNKIKTVLSIHNIEFQGKYNPIILGSIFGLDVDMRARLMYDGDLNLLKGGVESVDKVLTVSRTYAEEILTPAASHNLHHILNARQYKLSGIVNGIDTDEFNPETDEKIYKKYSYETIRFKAFNKKMLQREMGLKEDNNIPVIGMVTRLTAQKGIDLLCEIEHELKNLPVQLIVLGTGDTHFEHFFTNLEYEAHDKVRGYIGFSGAMAQKIYAGADMFLMPSKQEPCGLSQMIAMRYGTVPIVHSVGGLKDTVTPFNPEDKTGCGVTFQSFNAYDMLDAIKRAIALYNEKPLWRALRKNAMGTDFGWERSAKEYKDMYQSLISE